jgi:hypothetical protein
MVVLVVAAVDARCADLRIGYSLLEAAQPCAVAVFAGGQAD